MRPEEVHAFLTRRPFMPFRIHLTDGTMYEVRHPDQCILTRSAIIVGIPHPTQPWAQRVAFYSLIHVNRLESVEAEQPT